MMYRIGWYIWNREDACVDIAASIVAAAEAVAKRPLSTMAAMDVFDVLKDVIAAARSVVPNEGAVLVKVNRSPFSRMIGPPPAVNVSVRLVLGSTYEPPLGTVVSGL
jgi:hypothetical protein